MSSLSQKLDVLFDEAHAHQEAHEELVQEFRDAVFSDHVSDELSARYDAFLAESRSLSKRLSAVVKHA